MKNTWAFALGMAFTLCASAKDVQVAAFDPAQLHLIGSSCTFDRKARETVLASDWAGKFWMQIDGKMIELVSRRADREAAEQLADKRWHEVLTKADLIVELSLVETGRGEDSVAYKGSLEVKRRGSSTKIPVNGGCGA
jgi:hypothetical protein